MKAGLVGHHIGPSLTPALHEAEGAALGLDYHYARFDTADGTPLAQVVARARAAGYAGLNITHPHKPAVVALLDRLEGAAAEVRSVNTVVFRGTSAIGHNTDYSGFRAGLRRTIGDITGQHVRQLGSGGAGAAVALALIDAGVRTLTIFDTRPVRADVLIATLAKARPGARVRAVTSPDETASEIGGVVNTTPLGMADTPGMAVDPTVFSSRAWAADIVYFPRDTAFLRAAQGHGMQVMDGTQMALWQAVEAFGLITEHAPDPARMASHLSELLHARDRREAS